jgi:phospholipid/cholesterol/gamma-HCH transport system ATP-binding protein
MIQGDTERTHLLRPGEKLQEYRIERLLGQGGFGVTYLAQNMELGHWVALKEYFPSLFAVRSSNREVTPRDSFCEDEFTEGKERFLNEARILSQFNHPSIVHVERFFERFGTAYLAMTYVDGESLARRLKRCPAPWTFAEFTSTLLPLLDGLEAIHAADFSHRDITPNTIQIGTDGVPVLVDFGAARQTLGGRSGVLINLVTPGYAPLEQYWRQGEQGPWSDIYSLAAVFYRCIAGAAPVDAPARHKKDPLVPAVEIGRGLFPHAVLEAIDWGLTVDEDNRPRSIAEWRPLLSGQSPRSEIIPLLDAPPSKAPPDTLPAEPKQETGPDAPNHPAKIALRGVTKRFGPKVVLNGIDLSVGRSESLVVIGGSGTGKSVMLKCILGLLTPESGSIQVDGVETVHYNRGDREQLLRKFGMLFQGAALFDSLRVWENVAFGLIQGQAMPRKQAKEVALAKLAAVGLGADVAELAPAELSGGMQKRVALARAIATEPEIIFFDEPTTGLDPIMADVINELIVKCVKELGITALSITHDMASARKIADHIAMIYQGQIIWYGNRDDVEHSGNPFVDQFINGRGEGPIKMQVRAL